MILLIDNYDSFTYNLYQQVGRFYDAIKVVRNDKISLTEIEELKPTCIILSPGPGRPEDAGLCIDIIQSFHQHIPILGICLGHQAIAQAFGGEVIGAKEIMHGKKSPITHKGRNVFAGLPQEVDVMRYHSLAVKAETLPKELVVEAETTDGEIMAISHVRYPVVGIQFHPESIGTETGSVMIENFLQHALQASQGGERR
ncbi:MAG: anthranilate synthase component II [Bacillus sp. (in: firmicutes)]